MAKAMSYATLRRKAKSNKRKMQAGRGAKYADKYSKYRALKRASAARPAYTKAKRAATSMITTAPVQMGTSVSGGLQSSFTQRQNKDGSLRITGRSFITQISTLNKFTNGLLAVHDCNPVLLNDRVATIASTYEKYVYQSVTYRYVPQCSTSTAGSVMLTFERDPANPAADGGDSNFMQNVMSYEHTAITPPWVGSSVTYQREKAEKKLFYISGQGSNSDPRDTSQGLFMCYGTNIPTATGGVGFIVMDYVLDLCQPSIMPARTGANISSSSTAIPTQFRFGNVCCVNKFDVVGQSSNVNNWFDISGASALYGPNNANTLLEIFLEGNIPGLLDAGNVNWATSEQNAKAPTPAPMGRGTHLYIVVRRRTPGGTINTQPNTLPSASSVAIVCRSLAEALAALSSGSDLVSITGSYAYNNTLYPVDTLGQSDELGIGGWYRQLTLKASDAYQV